MTKWQIYEAEKQKLLDRIRRGENIDYEKEIQAILRRLRV